MNLDPRLINVVEAQPYTLLFVTISGAHLYGFPSADSDYDLRGVHILPLAEVMGLGEPRETIEVMQKPDTGGTPVGPACRTGRLMGEMPMPLELDLVTHDVKKFMLLMLRKNGYVLEQLYSPLVVHTTPEHEELKVIGAGCITRHHSHHYLGFARTQWDLFRKEEPPKVKPLLYVYRVLLTGIHLMRAGRIEANLLKLNTRDLCGEGFPLPYIDELVARKVDGGERGRLAAADLTFHDGEYRRLTARLEQAAQESTLPQAPSAKDAMNDLLLRVRSIHAPTHGMTYFRMASEVEAGGSRDCPVCQLQNAFDEADSYDICKRCGWEDDPVQRNNPDFPGGANHMSLREARRAWAEGRGIS